jgi:hypothetical protein
MVKLVTLLVNVLMLRIHIVMKKKFPRKKRNIKRETGKEIKEKSSRKTSTRDKAFPHMMKIMIATMIQKEYSSWKWKLGKEMKKIMKKVK